jgi:transketolase
VFQSLAECRSILQLEDSARLARLASLEMHHKSKTSHIGSSFSCIEILFALFAEKQLRIHNNFPSLEIIVSKGHAASAVYSVLNILGEIDDKALQSYCENGSSLYGHVSHFAHKWIPLSTGSLGHGLPYGIGLAESSRLLHNESIVAVLISDGELNEGTTWESALIANALELGNLVCFIDANGIQSMGNVEQVLPLEPQLKKWESFGWNVLEVDGHDFSSILAVRTHRYKPTAVILRTTKGKGVPFMEDNLAWHYKSPDDSQLRESIQHLS